MSEGGHNEKFNLGSPIEPVEHEKSLGEISFYEFKNQIFNDVIGPLSEYNLYHYQSGPKSIEKINARFNEITKKYKGDLSRVGLDASMDLTSVGNSAFVKLEMVRAKRFLGYMDEMINEGSMEDGNIEEKVVGLGGLIELMLYDLEREYDLENPSNPELEVLGNFRSIVEKYSLLCEKIKHHDEVLDKLNLYLTKLDSRNMKDHFDQTRWPGPLKRKY